MSKSVSNNALWEKLLEMDKKLNELTIPPATKEIMDKIDILGLSND